MQRMQENFEKKLKKMKRKNKELFKQVVENHLNAATSETSAAELDLEADQIPP